ncbi:hypothetical protein FTV91_22910 [Escherichia coli]|nr:hypothetical protein FTV91_22910 [Escherichia coli]
MGQSAGAMVVNKPSSGGPVPSEYSLGQIIRAWSPFLILTVLVTIWTMKPFKALFAPGGAFYSLVINFQIPHLHQQVLKAAPIVAQPTPMDAVFKFDPLSAGGTAIFIAAIISIFILGVGIKKGIGVFAETLISLKGTDIVDWHGAGVRLRHQLFRHVHHAGAGTGRYRRDVPVFLTVPRLAGGIPYRLGHFFKRPVWFTAIDHGAANQRL